MGKLCSVQGVVILGLIIQNMISIPKFKNLPARGYYVCKREKFQNIVWANSTLGSRGYFFLMDTDGSRRSRVNEAQSAEEKKIFFSPRPFFLL